MDVFTVETLLRKRIRNGQIQYLVRWRGFTDKHNTWEPGRNILDKSLISEFNKRIFETSGGFFQPETKRLQHALRKDKKWGEETEEKNKEKEKEEDKKEVEEREEEGAEEGDINWKPTDAMGRSAVQGYSLRHIRSDKHTRIAAATSTAPSLSIVTQKRGNHPHSTQHCPTYPGELSHTSGYNPASSPPTHSISYDGYQPPQQRETMIVSPHSLSMSSEQQQQQALGPSCLVQQGPCDVERPEDIDLEDGADEEEEVTLTQSEERMSEDSKEGCSEISSEDEWKPEKKRKADSESDSSMEEQGSVNDEEPQSQKTGASPLPSSSSSSCRRRTSCRKRSRKEGSKRQRQQFDCPIMSCKGQVVYLYRHMIQVHKDIPRHEINQLLKKTMKTKRVLHIWKCREKGCGWKGNRLDKHLVSKRHGLDMSEAKAKSNESKRHQVPNVGVKRNLSADSFVTCDLLSTEFLGWFSSIEGGNFVPNFLEEHKKTQRNVQNKKIANMVKVMLSCEFGDDEFHISRLAELVKMGRKSPSLISKLSEDRTWGTVRNYLHAFSHFLAYLEASLPVGLDVQTINAIKVSLKGCIHTVTKLSQEEMQRRKVADRKRLLDWDDVCKYIDSKMADACMKEFMCSEDKIESAETFGKHLLLQIAIQNGKRTGIYADLSVQDFSDAEKEMGGYVMLVDEGKTFRVTGGAGIFISKAEHALLRVFIEKCRVLYDPHTDQIFCRASGQRSTVADIHKSLEEVWKAFGNKENKCVGKISCSLLRKTLVTRSRKLGVDRSVQEQMARHMDHSISTADRHYDVNTGIRITAKFRQIIERFKESEEEFDSDSDSEGSDTESENLINEEISSIPLAESVLKARPVGVTPATCPSGCVSQSGDSAFKFGRPVIFSEEDTQRLKRCCDSVIQSGRRKACTVTKSMIVGAVQSAGPNFSDLLKKYTEAQLCSKIRTEIRKL